MSTKRPAHNISISIASNGADKRATVAITGPSGQWSAALSTYDPHNFVSSILDVVREDLMRICTRSRPEWPGADDE